MKTLLLSIILILSLSSPLLLGCANPDKEATISFTRQALEIEKQRDELVKDNTQYGKFVFKKQLPDLVSKVTWLECPSELQIIKNALIQIYHLEIQSLQDDQYPTFVNRFNYKQLAPVFILRFQNWYNAQKLRDEAYTHWAQLLKDSGIDLPKEGFTELIIK